MIESADRYRRRSRGTRGRTRKLPLATGLSPLCEKLEPVENTPDAVQFSARKPGKFYEVEPCYAVQS